jgi:hypothetical protein
VQAELLVSAEENSWEKIIREAFEEDEVRIKKEKENKASSNIVTPAKGLHSNQANDYDDVYFDEKANKVKSNDKNDSNDSEEEIPDKSDDDRYNGYDEYSERDRDYYYRDKRYERKISPMMSSIISPVIV